MRIVYSVDSLANTTQGSLENLRDVLSLFYEDIKLIVQVNVQDGLCGFAIIVFEKAHIHYAHTLKSGLFGRSYTMFFTGYGFRQDKEGESGRGYIEALKLLEEFRIPEVTIKQRYWSDLDSNNFNSGKLIAEIVKVVGELWNDLESKIDSQSEYWEERYE